MRRTLAIAISCLCALVLFAPAAHARSGPTVTTQVLAPLQGIMLDGVCPFPVRSDERGSRTLTTVYDRSGRMVAQHLTGGFDVVLTNTAKGIALPFEVGGTAIAYHRNGTATVLQHGRSGIAYDQGRVSGVPSLTWFSGTVITTGTVDPKTFTIDVTAQRRFGLQDDICEMLVTGLKTRH